MTITIHPDLQSLIPPLGAEQVALVAHAAADIRTLLAHTAQNLVTIGQTLQAVKAALPHGQWEAWLRQEFDWSLSSALKMIHVAERFKSVNITDLRLDVSSLYLLAAPSTPPAARAEAVALAQDGAALSVPRVKALINKHKGVVTLETYKAGQALPMLHDTAPVACDDHAVFNRTNEQVDWAWWTWNPVHGCEHNCEYCYARDYANRFYPEKFEPTFHPERLHAPHNTPLPPEAATNIGARNVFVVSMGDLFGKWVPQEWIDAVLAAVRTAPQWNFLFLTKFPQRLAEIQWPGNAWVGTSVDAQYRVAIAERAFRTIEAPVKWLSCEPLRERLTFSSLEMFDWVVVGGQSRSSGAPAFQPPWEWVEHLLRQARAAGCHVYFKPNLETRPQEYPGQRVVQGTDVAVLEAAPAAAPPHLPLGAPPPAPPDPAPPPDPTPRREVVGLQAAVLRTVRELQPCTNAQVAKALGKPRNATHQALQSLVKQGKARKEGLTYSVVEAPTGKAIADGVVG